MGKREVSIRLEFRWVYLALAPFLALVRESDHPQAQKLVRGYGG